RGACRIERDHLVPAGAHPVGPPAAAAPDVETRRTRGKVVPWERGEVAVERALDRLGVAVLLVVDRPLEPEALDGVLVVAASCPARPHRVCSIRDAARASSHGLLRRSGARRGSHPWTRTTPGGSRR